MLHVLERCGRFVKYIKEIRFAADEQNTVGIHG